MRDITKILFCYNQLVIPIMNTIGLICEVPEEGYPKALAVNYSSIPDEFVCPVCHDICKAPVATKCHHIFCKSCITFALKRIRVCPCCRESVTQGELPSLSENNPVLNRMYGRIQMKCMLHTKGCTWTGNIVDMNAHMNGCVHNVDAILKRAEVAEAKVKALEAILKRAEVAEAKVRALEAQNEVAEAKVKALEAQNEAQRKEAAIELENHRQSIDTTHRNMGGYSFHDTSSMMRIANKIAQCARLREEPVGGWKSAYAALKEAHTDWVRNAADEPENFHWQYGNMLSAAYLSGAPFYKNQRDNINTWLWNYWRRIKNPYPEGRA